MKKNSYECKKRRKQDGVRASQMKGQQKDDRDKMSNYKWLVEDGAHKKREIR